MLWGKYGVSLVTGDLIENVRSSVWLENVITGPSILVAVVDCSSYSPGRPVVHHGCLAV